MGETMRNIEFSVMQFLHYNKRKITGWLEDIGRTIKLNLIFINFIFNYLNIFSQNCFSLFYNSLLMTRIVISFWKNRQTIFNKRPRDWICFTSYVIAMIT